MDEVAGRTPWVLLRILRVYRDALELFAWREEGLAVLSFMR